MESDVVLGLVHLRKLKPILRRFSIIPTRQNKILDAKLPEEPKSRQEKRKGNQSHHPLFFVFLSNHTEKFIEWKPLLVKLKFFYSFDPFKFQQLGLPLLLSRRKVSGHLLLERGMNNISTSCRKLHLPARNTSKRTP